MSDILDFLRTLDQRFPIVDPETGKISDYFLRRLKVQVYGTDGIIDEIEDDLTGKADKSITLTAGAGLTGGGDLSANRSFAVGAGTGITVNADDVALSNTAVTPGSYTNTDLTVDAQGRITAAANGSGGGGASFSGCRVTNSTGLSSRATMTWDTEAFDVGGWHSTSSNTERLTVPSGVSYVSLNLYIPRTASTTGQLGGFIEKYNSSDVLQGRVATSETDTAGGDFVTASTGAIDVVAGDYFVATSFDTTSGNLDSGAYGAAFSITKLG